MARLTSAIPETFFQSLLPAWGKDPRAFQKPFELIMTPEEAFAGLLHTRDRMLRGDRSIQIRVFGDGVEIVSDIAGYAPREEDRTLHGYISRLSLERGRRFGIMVKNFQAAVPSSWSHFYEFMTRAYHDIPRSEWNYVDLFFGNYERTFFGLHKDDVDVVTFVLEGQKKFLVWPFEAFDVPEEFRYEQFSLPNGLIEPKRESAVVLEGSPGDVFYWPSTHWHIAESTGETVVTLSLALTRPSAPNPWLDEAVLTFVQAQIEQGELPPATTNGGDQEAIARHVARTTAAFLGEEGRGRFQRMALEAALRQTTMAGFRVAPARHGAVEILESDRVRMPGPPFPVWARIGHDVVCAANGGAIGCPRGTEAIALLEALLKGEFVKVASLLPSSIESRSDLLVFLGALCEIRAIERVTSQEAQEASAPK